MYPQWYILTLAIRIKRVRRAKITILFALFYRLILLLEDENISLVKNETCVPAL